MSMCVFSALAGYAHPSSRGRTRLFQKFSSPPLATAHTNSPRLRFCAAMSLLNASGIPSPTRATPPALVGSAAARSGPDPALLS